MYELSVMQIRGVSGGDLKDEGIFHPRSLDAVKYIATGASAVGLVLYYGVNPGAGIIPAFIAGIYLANFETHLPSDPPYQIQSDFQGNYYASIEH